MRIEPRGDRPFLDAVLDVRLHPVLDRLAERGAAVNDRHRRAGAEQVERRFGGGVLAADDDDALAEERMRLGVVVRHVRQVLARHADPVRDVIRAGRDHDRPRVHRRGARRAPTGCRRRTIRAHRVPSSRVIASTVSSNAIVQLEDVRHAAVIAQRLEPRRLVVGAGERHAADLHQLRCREEHHLDRIVQQRIDERALFDHQMVEAVLVAAIAVASPAGPAPMMTTSNVCMVQGWGIGGWGLGDEGKGTTSPIPRPSSRVRTHFPGRYSTWMLLTMATGRPASRSLVRRRSSRRAPRRAG